MCRKLKFCTSQVKSSQVKKSLRHLHRLPSSPAGFRSTFDRLPYGCLLFLYRLDLTYLHKNQDCGLRARGGRSMPGDHAPPQGDMGAVLGVQLRYYGFTDLPPSLPLPNSSTRSHAPTNQNGAGCCSVRLLAYLQSVRSRPLVFAPNSVRGLDTYVNSSWASTHFSVSGCFRQRRRPRESDEATIPGQ